MPRSRTPTKGTSNNTTPVVIDEKHPEFENMVNEYVSYIERNESNCENTGIAPLQHPLFSKYGNKPGYGNVTKEAHIRYNIMKQEANQRSAARVEDNQSERDKEGCTISGGSRKKRGTRQNKKRRGHKSQRHKSYR
jgi:hypothetical protein